MGNMGWWDIWGMVADGDLLQGSFAPLPCLPGQIQVLLHLLEVVCFLFTKACQQMWGTRGWWQGICWVLAEERMHCCWSFHLIWLHLCWACAWERPCMVVVGDLQVQKTSHGEGDWPVRSHKFQSFWHDKIYCGLYCWGICKEGRFVELDNGYWPYLIISHDVREGFKQLGKYEGGCVGVEGVVKAGDGKNLAEESALIMPSLISPKTNRCKVYVHLWSRGNAKSSPRVVQQMCSIEQLGWWWRWWEQWWKAARRTMVEGGEGWRSCLCSFGNSFAYHRTLDLEIFVEQQAWEHYCLHCHCHHHTILFFLIFLVFSFNICRWIFSFFWGETFF